MVVVGFCKFNFVYKGYLEKRDFFSKVKAREGILPEASY